MWPFKNLKNSQFWYERVELRLTSNLITKKILALVDVNIRNFIRWLFLFYGSYFPAYWWSSMTSGKSNQECYCWKFGKMKYICVLIDTCRGSILLLEEYVLGLLNVSNYGLLYKDFFLYFHLIIVNLGPFYQFNVIFSNMNGMTNINRLLSEYFTCESYFPAYRLHTRIT